MKRLLVSILRRVRPTKQFTSVNSCQACGKGLLSFAVAMALLWSMAKVVPIRYVRAKSADEKTLEPNPRIKPLDAAIIRTNPPREPAASVPVFSKPPTDVQITQARVFEEPFVRIEDRFLSQSPVLRDAENEALAEAIIVYLEKADPEDVSSLTSFLNQYPRSGWRASLLTDLGIVYRRTGYFLKALDAWEKAWKLSKNATEVTSRAIADRAVGELAELNARLGRYDSLEKLFAELGNRDVHGPATEKLTGAREGLSIMRNEPGIAFRCGPMALDRIRAAGSQSDAFDPMIVGTHSTQRGLSLENLAALANSLKMNYQMAHRRAGTPVITPAIVHWKAGHFAALTKATPAAPAHQQEAQSAGGTARRTCDRLRYLVQDPTFGDDIWVTQATLDAEASGYFLVPKGKLPAGWRGVRSTEGRDVWGKGNTNSSDPEYQTKCDDKPKPGCPTCGKGMAEYNFHTMLVALNIVDTPVGYTPPRGPAVNFTVTYNQRDVYQPSTFSYSNVGTKWTHNWLSYVTDDPTNLIADVKVYVRGGGQETYTGFNSGTQQFATQMRSRTVLVRTTGTGYERRSPDGSKEFFDLADGANTFPRKVFLTGVMDPFGNLVSLFYDSSLRITSIRDAIGQVTTLSYLDATQPLKITKVTDPFGRFATFEYNFLGQLFRITDVINLASGFGYGDQDFINTMITPYGITSFTLFINQNDATNRRITATDPTGDTEKLEFKHNAPGVTSSDPANTVPTGMLTHNDFLQYRNTFYWDKQAYASFPNDFTKARMSHWLHSTNTAMSAGIKESEKMPLERRVWYNYPGQSDPIFLGTTSRVTKAGRVLDDGTTQLYQYQHNDSGNVTQVIDPSGRRTSYVYAANNIDLLEVRQTTGASNDLLVAYTYLPSDHFPRTMTDAARQTTTYTNANGQVNQIINAKNELSGYSYTTTGYLAAIFKTIPGPAATEFTYDAYGRVRTVTNVSDNYTIIIDYDALDRITKITYPDGTFQQITYDRLEVSETRDRLGRITTIAHDGERRVRYVRDPLNRETFFDWCKCGSLSSMTDPLQHTTTWNRDLQGRLTSKVLADNTHTDYVYETTTSRLKQITDAKGQITNYQYFGDDNLKQVSYTNSTTATPSVNYTYDATYNRVATIADGTGTTTHTYHPVVAAPSPPQLGATQLASIDGPLANDTITYSYDELERVLSRTINAISSSQTYDTLGRVTTVSNPLGQFGYTYDGVTSRLANITGTNGDQVVEMRYTYYDNFGDRRLKTLTNVGGQEGDLSSFFYSYQAEGQIGKIKRTLPAVTTDSHSIDTADQLTVFQRTSGGLTLKSTFIYDLAGNRTQEKIGTAVTNFGYNGVNELIDRTGAQGDATLAYDLNGSLIGDGTRTFEWDGANRLVAVNIGMHRSEFSYDGIGRRTRIVEKENSVVTSDHRYVWCRGVICEERDASGATVEKRFYEQGEQVSGANFYYTFDQLGSVRELLEFRGIMVTKFDYDPWGRQTKLVGTQDAVFGYAGYFRHQQSGLLLTWFRAYDANLARWTSRDPIEEEGGVNLYAYVANQPVTFNDPDGLIMLICYRRGWDRGNNPLKYFTQHSYFYWPQSGGTGGRGGTERTCGRYKGSSVPEDPRNEDPRNTVCREIPGSEGLEDDLIKCCESKNQQKRPYIPIKSDCQTDTDDCLKRKGLLPPAGNPGRFRLPWQTVSDNNKGTPYIFP